MIYAILGVLYLFQYRCIKQNTKYGVNQLIKATL